MNKPQNRKIDYSSKENRETINLIISSDIIEKIEDIRFYARKNLPKDKRKKLTKSMLYNLILKKAIEDHYQNGQNSLVCKTLDEWSQM